MQDKKRFFDKVEIIDTCWLWTAGCTSNGYGQFRLKGKKKLAHRVAYEWFVGPISIGLQLDHLCRVRNCVNPEHLEAVTGLENVRRGNRNHNKYKTHCIRGHEFTILNTYIRKDLKRLCKECERLRYRGLI